MLLLERMVEEKKEPPPPEVLREGVRAAARIERKYGKKNLGPYTDFEWGALWGKHVALRWVLGDDWDNGDT